MYLLKIDEWIDRVKEKFRADRIPQHDSGKMEQLVQEHRAASQTVEELVRFARTEGDQIVRRARQHVICKFVLLRTSSWYSFF